MTQPLKQIIKHFKRADKHNQLRPGETHLQIESFMEGFFACVSIVESFKLSEQEFELLMKDLGHYFDKFHYGA